MNPILIIVEGCDGSGKTTLIDQLEKVPDFPQFLRIRRSRRPKSEKEIALENLAISDITSRLIPVVLDRHPLISEPIYGNIIRKNPIINWHMDRPAPFLLRHPHTAIVYCRPSYGAIMKGILTNPQMPGVIDSMSSIVYEYDRRMEYLKAEGANVIYYDYQKMTAIDFWKSIISSFP